MQQHQPGSMMDRPLLVSAILEHGENQYGDQQIVSRGTGAANADAARVTRLPSGHPEGYLEGFATVYAEIAQALRGAA